jgi:ribA/ribD-fused uncharacterized protein
VTAIIDRFAGEHRFLSNFWAAKVTAKWGDERVEAPTVEHAYQAMKAVNRADFDRVLSAPKAGEARRLGREIPVRPLWEAEKFSVMLDLLSQKFSDDALAWHLLATGDAILVEGNDWHDHVWGVCNCGRCPSGQNKLGEMLELVRAAHHRARPTREEVMALQPGTAMDRLVAELVMGMQPCEHWLVEYDGDRDVMGDAWFRQDTCPHATTPAEGLRCFPSGDWGATKGMFGREFELPYSTDANHMMGVVSHLDSQGCAVALLTMRDGIHGSFAHVGYSRNPFDSFHTDADTEGATLAEALCRAALLASVDIHHASLERDDRAIDVALGTKGVA